MDNYLIPFDFRQKIKDAERCMEIDPRQYITDVQQLLDLIQELAEPYEERILALEMDVADLENSGGCDCSTGDYDGGYEDGLQSGRRTGFEEGMRRAREQMKEALGL